MLALTADERDFVTKFSCSRDVDTVTDTGDVVSRYVKFLKELALLLTVYR